MDKLFYINSLRSSLLSRISSKLPILYVLLTTRRNSAEDSRTGMLLAQ